MIRISGFVGVLKGEESGGEDRGGRDGYKSLKMWGKIKHRPENAAYSKNHAKETSIRHPTPGDYPPQGDDQAGFDVPDHRGAHWAGANYDEELG